MSILIQKPGILTTVQDSGRTGSRRFGINPGGAMDPAAPSLINLLIGNQERDAVLEMHFPAPQIVFEGHTAAILGGADFGPRLDGSPVSNWTTFQAKEGSVLTFAEKVAGNRAYLAVSGGFDVPQWLGSSATNLAAGVGGFDGRALSARDRIAIRDGANMFNPGRSISPWFVPKYARRPTVRVTPGSEFEALTETAREVFVSTEFEISSASNRMGFRLAGPAVTIELPIEMLSSGVSFGTIQALPDEQLIILMADHQTTGGYPRIAHVVSVDLPIVGQLGAGDRVSFQMIDLQEAERLALEYERSLTFLRCGVKFGAPN